MAGGRREDVKRLMMSFQLAATFYTHTTRTANGIISIPVIYRVMSC